MRATTTLLLRDLLSKLHPPAPTTAVESQRLLKLLDGSFRKRLDEAHPPLTAHRGEEQDQPTLAEPSRPAAAHIDSILHHPLLEAKIHHYDGLSSILKTPSSDPKQSPIEDFDYLLRYDQLTFSDLQRIARHYICSSRHGPALNRGQKLADRIAAWIASEEAPVKAAFLASPGVLLDIIPVMYADSREEVVWGWLRSLYQQETPNLDTEDCLISEMMRASIKNGNLSDAAQQFVQASHYRYQSRHVSVIMERTYSNQQYRPLLSSWKRISSAILSRRISHSISASNFDHLLRYAIPFSYHRVITRPFLELYHPTNPSAEALYVALRTPAFFTKWNTWHSKHRILHKTFLVSILDAAQLALSQQGTRQAQFFLSFTETHWPEFLPSTQPETSDTIEIDVETLTERIDQAIQQASPTLPFHRIHLAPG
jgi:hypothetical protein